MKSFLLLTLLLLSGLSFGQDKLTTHGLTGTNLDFVWKIKIKETAWTGQLDCQSFFHFLKLSSASKEINQYLDAQECQDWKDYFQRASAVIPVCVVITKDQSIERKECATKPIATAP